MASELSAPGSSVAKWSQNPVPTSIGGSVSSAGFTEKKQEGNKLAGSPEKKGKEEEKKHISPLN